MATGVQQQQRRGTAAQWNTANYVLAAGELGVTTDTGIIKIGDGVNGWNDLPAAFGSAYLPILGKAADSELLDGIGSEGFYKLADATTAATADKLAKRLSDGRLKAAAGTSTDDVVNYDQMAASVVDARKEAISRDVSANFTLALTDVSKLIRVNSTAYATSYNCTIPTNASVAFPIGSWVDVTAPGKGPAIVVPSSGVTYFGPTVIYGGGSLFRLLKTDTDAWHCIHVFYSPPPLLHRKMKVGSGGNILGPGFTTLRLDGANSAAFTDNADTLGTNEQYDASVDIYKCYARRSGWYDVRAQVTVNDAIGGRLYVTLKVNGTARPLGNGGPKGSVLDTGPMMSAYIPLNVGDYIEVMGFQEISGGATVVETNDSPSFFEWCWRRPL